MALVGACMLTNPFYFSTQLKSCQNTAYYRSPQKQQLLKLLHQLVCPPCAWWLLLERHCFFFQTSFQLLLQALYCFWEEEDMETLYIHCAHYEPLMSLAKDNLPSLGSFLRKRYCTERRKRWSITMNEFRAACIVKWVQGNYYANGDKWVISTFVNGLY